MTRDQLTAQLVKHHGKAEKTVKSAMTNARKDLIAQGISESNPSLDMRCFEIVHSKYSGVS